MKKVIGLFLIACVFFMISCNGNQAEREKKRADSIENAKKDQALEKLLAHQDTLADYAWGEIKFGITKKELLQTKMGKGGDVYHDCISMSFENRRAIGNAFYLKKFGYFDFIFENNELTEIRIKSYLTDANKIDDLVSDCDIFINNFKKKMGDPEYPLKGEKPSILSFTTGKSFRYATLLIGGRKSLKDVDVYLGENDNYDYYYEIIISNSSYPKKKKVKSTKEIEQEKKAEKERQGTISSSF